MKDTFEFGKKLESVYPLLDIIFEYLSDKDLDNVMNVKKSWEALAKRILKKRSKLCWVTCYRDRGNDVFSDSGNLHFNNSSIAIILFGSHHSLSSYISPHKVTDTSQQMKFLEYFGKEIVGRNIQFCILRCPKVVSSFSQAIENKYESIFDSVILPKIPGIRTSMFYCNFSKLKKTPALLDNHLRSDEQVKCLLLFDKYEVRSSIDNLFKIIFNNNKAEEVALGGGIIHKSHVFQNEGNITEEVQRSKETFCIAFTSKRGMEPNFNAASYVLSGTGLTDEEMNEKLLKFRKSVIMRKNRIVFRVCCQAKSDKKKECVIFNAHFPDTPLLGLEAGGEIGWNCFNLTYDGVSEHETSNPKRSKKPYPNFRHEWSTIFIVLTWGDII